MMKSPVKFIEKYGTVFRFIKYGNTITIKGILQPYHYSYNSFFTHNRLPAGVCDPRHYLLITTPDLSGQIYKDLLILGEDRDYVVKSVETFSVKGEDLYVWAVLTACTES